MNVKRVLITMLFVGLLLTTLNAFVGDSTSQAFKKQTTVQRVDANGNPLPPERPCEWPGHCLGRARSHDPSGCGK